MTHSISTSAFQSATSKERKSKKSLRSSKLNNSTPSLFDTESLAAIEEENYPLAPIVDNPSAEFSDDCEEEEEMLYPPMWHVVAYDYNGDEHTEEVEAYSEYDANRIATRIFTSQGIDIYHMCLYSY